MVVDESTATADEDGGPAREARALLLALAGGGAPDAAVVWSDRAAADGVVGPGGVATALGAGIWAGWEPEAGEVSEKSTANRGKAGAVSGGGMRTDLRRSCWPEFRRKPGRGSPDGGSSGNQKGNLG